MQQFSSTQAKQNFGQLMKASALAPVAIERHGKVQALVMSPDFHEAARAAQDLMAERRLARLQQAGIEKDRLIRHHRIALDLLTVEPAQRAGLIQQARDTVDRWRREQLSSRDYVDRWAALLALPVQELAKEMVADADGWGTALRQNSPWVGLRT
ncbi:type II toxin-antitoxin system Phd/YefM family antitoxin [Hydrogenophaga sp.]|uniref:type II toxin-antitoxin system Phd/YefM family antitoxin n=1 Tax=Hydrogenophaga sp. TaxID=1904254 RepID=UPI0025C6CADD|nr:type II toxin-antitoxin system Phd/YefM family antitoxin [Hydrogenophaga sp.]MBT9466050.1 type II toxin-antitoxin system Phd/YefM family antitoxin [Hydrogenophaga sp.]